jgi:Ca2+/Na+ antiporter
MENFKHLDLIICLSSTIIYIFIIIIFSIKIKKIKKELKIKSISENKSKFISTLILSIFLILLVYLIPMERWQIILLCLCSIFAELIVFRERIDLYQKKSKKI